MQFRVQVNTPEASDAKEALATFKEKGIIKAINPSPQSQPIQGMSLLIVVDADGVEEAMQKCTTDGAIVAINPAVANPVVAGPRM